MTKGALPRSARVGTGPGWGGPAKGKGTGKRPAFEPGTSIAGAHGRTGETIKRAMTKQERAERLAEIVEAAAEKAFAGLAEAKLPNEVAALVTAASAAAMRGSALLIGTPVAHTVLTGANAGPIQIEDTRPPIAELLMKAQAALKPKEPTND